MCFVTIKSLAEDKDSLLRHCLQEKVLQALSFLMKAGRGRRCWEAYQSLALMLHLWWVLHRASHHTAVPVHHCIPQVPVLSTVRLHHSGSRSMSCTSVWSYAVEVRREQRERPSAAAQSANRSKLSNSARKPLCCLGVKAGQGVARRRMLQVEPMSCIHFPKHINPREKAFLYTYGGCVSYGNWCHLNMGEDTFYFYENTWPRRS